MNRFREFLILVLFAGAVGCSSGPQPVEGTVVWEDGSPATEIAGSLVNFENSEKGISARGQIKPDGTFKVSVNNKDGAMPGEYKVLVVEIGRKPLAGGDGSQLAPGMVDPRYSDPSTSDLKATIQSGVNRIKLTLKKPGKK